MFKVDERVLVQSITDAGLWCSDGSGIHLIGSAGVVVSVDPAAPMQNLVLMDYGEHIRFCDEELLSLTPKEDKHV